MNIFIQSEFKLLLVFKSQWPEGDWQSFNPLSAEAFKGPGPSGGSVALRGWRKHRGWIETSWGLTGDWQILSPSDICYCAGCDLRRSHTMCGCDGRQRKWIVVVGKTFLIEKKDLTFCANLRTSKCCRRWTCLTVSVSRVCPLDPPSNPLSLSTSWERQTF